MTIYLELLYLISFTGVLAVAYSYLLSGQIISASPGNARMQEIAEAIQIGAKAYLNRGITKQMTRDEDGACSDWSKAKELGIMMVKKYLANDCE